MAIQINIDDFKTNEHESRIVHRSNRYRILISSIPGECAGPPRHTHTADQLYYILTGAMTIALGSERFVARPGDCVFIPAGVPHHNWNDGTGQESHLEVIAAGQTLTEPFTFLVDHESVRQGYYVVSAAAKEGATRDAALERLADASTGSIYCALSLATIPANAWKQEFHDNDYDEMYYCISGSCFVDLDEEAYQMASGSFLVAPAGVRHRVRSHDRSAARYVLLGMDMPGREGHLLA